ncbi:MAG TPA: class I SAM-dependent methyltransferase [Candidatus Udaeobacter sp.]|jgi:SAM-dependent methyltransferase|nr:class I SAM-dependent methyltransferase [Candidatus Udaeobacter sp.]
MSVSARSKCPACHSENIQDLFTVPDYEYNLSYRAPYAKCLDCLSFFQLPMPDFAGLSGYYPANYHSFETNKVLAKLKQKQRLKRLRSLVGSDKISLLDYGCGNGAFIKESAKEMPTAKFYGYEISSQDEKQILVEERVTLLKGSFEFLLKELPVCDLITMNHVIEHLRDPWEILSALQTRLDPNGILEGQTPATDSLEQSIFKKKWSGFHAPRHTVIFSKKGLRKILERAGFAQTQITPAFNPAGIAVSLANLSRGDSPGNISRRGLRWLFYVGVATLLYPIDLMSGAPGMINFCAKKGLSE